MTERIQSFNSPYDLFCSFVELEVIDVVHHGGDIDSAREG